MTQHMEKEALLRQLNLPNGPEKLMEQADAAFAPAYELFAEGDPAAAAFLCRCAKKKAFREQLIKALGQERRPLRAALESDVPKLRKNAARLVGELMDPTDVPFLIAALKNESQRFVRPSMLLAMGAVGGGEAEAFLNSYVVTPAADPSEARHVREENEALSAAKKQFLNLKKHPFLGLDEPLEIELRAPDKLTSSLASELSALGVEVRATKDAALRVHTTEVEKLFYARCFYELLFPVSAGTAADPKLLARLAVPAMERLLRRHGGEPPMGYRIEVQGDRADRGDFARAMAAEIPEDVFANAPGDYEMELRVERKDNGGADLYIKLYTLSDHRFDYRVGALPASMNPVTAAAVLRYAGAFLRPGARVLDPCCGSGTFLLERGKLSPCATLTGVDIAQSAVDIAKVNAAAAHSKAKFIRNDCLRFVADSPYDELVANLPFGNRVGSHNDNLRLYVGILDRIPSWLHKDGIAVLYTMEYTLLKKLVRDRPFLKLITEVRTEAGGLMPAVFILKVL